MLGTQNKPAGNVYVSGPALCLFMFRLQMPEISLFDASAKFLIDKSSTFPPLS